MSSGKKWRNSFFEENVAIEKLYAQPDYLSCALTTEISLLVCQLLKNALPTFIFFNQLNKRLIKIEIRENEEVTV